MATTDQVVFLKSLQQYEESLNSLVKHYSEIAAASKEAGKERVSSEVAAHISSEVAAHIYSLVRRDVTNIIKAYRLTMEV